MKAMRAFDLSNQEVYSPSAQSVTFLRRNLEDNGLNLEKRRCHSLAKSCLKVMAKEFGKINFYEKLTCLERNYLSEILSTELDLEVLVPLIQEEHYWKRRFLRHYENLPTEKHFGWTWKCIYLEHHIQTLCEITDPKMLAGPKFQSLLDLCALYIHRLELNQHLFWRQHHPSIRDEIPEVLPSYSIDFKSILEKLPKVQEVSFMLKTENIGDVSAKHILKVSYEDCERLTEATSCLKRLKIFRLHNTSIECNHVLILTKGLTNWHLVILDLSYCRIGDPGAKAIAVFCKKHENLKVLKLKSNRIGAEGARGLAWALLLRVPLKHLDLSDNAMGSEGVMELCGALTRNRSLRQLVLSNCQAKVDTRVTLGAMLQYNRSLRTMDISNNDLHPDEGKEILSALEENTGLLTLNLRNTGIPLDEESEIQILLKRNFERRASRKFIKTAENHTYVNTDLNSVIFSI